MLKSTQRESAPNGDSAIAASADTDADQVPRIQAKDLFGQAREVEIAHGGRIYRLRLTQLNKLILTA